ncbi:Ulp1-like peptidase [Cucumis melo var. makuwa]|uniref:Ulp1-like peptidase n=1 Tax=Cucumis melo var. makuwa TaxID=1194695 RepID=A0A5A7UAU1_CUCMM|nr:Ulp1-like peptidase [Cucumis melo var. makuwa]
MESRIRGDDNMKREDDESMPDIDNSDNTTPDDTTNNQSLDNNNLQSTSSLQLSPRRKKDKQQHQEESGSDIHIDGRDADLLLTIRDISDNLNAQSQKEKDLPEMITTLPLVSQPLPFCEILPSSSSTLNQPAMAQLDQIVKIHEVPPSISIVNEKSQPTMDLLLSHLQKKMLSIKKLCKYTFRAIDFAFITGINKPHYIVWQRLFDTHLLTADNKKVYWKDTTTHLNLWTEEDLECYFNTAVGDFQEKPGWGDVNYVIGCINIKEH